MQILGFGGSQLSATPQVFQALSLGGSPPAAPVQPFGTPNQNVVPVKTPASNAPLNLTLQAQPTVDAINALSRAATLSGVGGPVPFTQTPPPSTLTGPGTQNGTLITANPPVGLVPPSDVTVNTPAQPQPSVTNPPVVGSPPNSTAFVGATVPDQTVVQGAVTPPNTPPPQGSPSAISFTIVAPPPDQTTTQQIAQQSITTPQQAAPPTPPPPFTLANTSDTTGATAKPAPTTSNATSSSPTNTPATPTVQTPNAPAPSLPAAANSSLVQAVVSTVQSLLIGKVYPQPVFSFFA